MQSADAIELLRSLLHEMRATPAGIKEARFRAKHADQQDLIDDLIFHQGRILRQDGCLLLRPLSIADLASADPLASNLHAASARVFEAVREFTKAGADEKIPIETLASYLRMFAGDLVELVKPMADMGIFATYDLTSDKPYVMPSVTTVLRHKTYDDLIEQQRRWAADNAVASPLHSLSPATARGPELRSRYVDPKRLEDLRSIASSHWDLTRLIRLCEELNIAHEHDAWMTSAMAVRGIVDHVPPIFSCSNFAEVSNNYAGSRSFRQHMQHLDNSLRRVADAHLHVQIRPSESLPTFVQVDFRADLDALLGEIARILKGSAQ